MCEVSCTYIQAQQLVMSEAESLSAQAEFKSRPHTLPALSMQEKKIHAEKLAFQHGLSKVKQRFNFQQLTRFQEQTFQHIYDRDDVFVIADTGSGKSVCFLGITDILQPNNNKCITLCISPLKSLCRNQVELCAKLPRPLSAKHLESADDIDTKVRNGDYKVLYVAPELLSDETFLQMVDNSEFRGMLRTVVLDEADCVSWKDFRTAWDAKKLAEFFARFVDSDVTFFACTATMPEWKYTTLVRDLCMHDCKLVRSDTRRDNIFLDVHSRPRAWDDICRTILDPIVADLLAHGRQV